MRRSRQKDFGRGVDQEHRHRRKEGDLRFLARHGVRVVRLLSLRDAWRRSLRRFLPFGGTKPRRAAFRLATYAAGFLGGFRRHRCSPDRRPGRTQHTLFLATIVFMAAATFLVGLPAHVPDHRLGGARPAGHLRLVQGLARVASDGGASTYVAEHAAARKARLRHELDPRPPRPWLLPGLAVIGGCRL